MEGTGRAETQKIDQNVNAYVILPLSLAAFGAPTKVGVRHSFGPCKKLYSWTLMHYGQYKQVALTTPSNACYARSPKPIWASKRNRGHGKDDITIDSLKYILT